MMNGRGNQTDAMHHLPAALIQVCWNRGVWNIEIEFYADISQESRCNSEIKVSAPFYKILVFL